MSSNTITWLFQVGSNHWAFETVSYDGQTYTARVLPEKFSGINLRQAVGGNLIAKNDVAFTVSNVDGALNGADFIGESVIIRLLIDGILTRAWKFKVKSTAPAYGELRFNAVDILQDKIKGDWPNTPSPKAVWPSEDQDPDEDYCIPVVLGNAYVPLRSVNTGIERHYILGKSGPTYNITGVSSPHDWSNSSTWLAAEYTMAQSVQGDFQGLQPMIYDDEGTFYPGLWRSGDRFLDVLCQFTRSDTAGLTNPADWIAYTLESFGVATSDIDTTTFNAAKATYSGRSMHFHGGWWQKEARENVISSLLSQCDSYFTIGENIELRPFSKTSVETFTQVLKKTFSGGNITVSESDGGEVRWQNAGKPQDVLSGQCQVGTYNGQPIISSPDGSAFDARFLADSQDAQTAGTLYFQKKHCKKRPISFAVGIPSVTTLGTLSPGMVVTVNNPLYGGMTSIILSEMSISRDKVRFSGIEMSHIEDWADITSSVIVIGPGEAVVFPGPDAVNLNDYVEKVTYNTDIAAIQAQIDNSITTWFYDGAPTLSNLPASDWTTDDDKNIHLGDIYYDNLTGYAYRFKVDTGVYSWLRITDSDITAALATASQAQDTADSKRRVFFATPVVPYDAGDLWDSPDGLKRSSVDQTVAYNASDWVDVADPAGYGLPAEDAGDLAFEDLVELAKLGDTIIQGGYIKTTLINAGSLYIGDFSGAGDLATEDFVDMRYDITNKSLANLDSAANSKLNGIETGATRNTGDLADLDVVQMAQLGTTIVSGGYIKTELIDVDDLFVGTSLTGSITFSGLYSSIDFGGIYSKINFPGSCYIDGVGGLGVRLLCSSNILTVQKDSNGITLNAGASGADIKLYANDQVYVRAGSSDKINFQFSTTTKMYMNSSGLFAQTDSTPTTGMYVGYTGNSFHAMFAYKYYDEGGGYLDLQDDLAVMSEFKPRKKITIDPETGIKTISQETDINPENGLEYMDLLSLPRWMTNYADVVKKLKADNGDLLTDADIAELIQDQNEAGWMLARDMGAYNDLTSGAVRQLDRNIIQLFEDTWQRITALEYQTGIKKPKTEAA